MPRRWRSRVAVLLVLLLVATLLPTSAIAAEPTPTPDPSPIQTPPSEPAAEPALDPSADDGGQPTADPTADTQRVLPAGAGDRYLVLLKDGADVGKALKRLEGKAGFKAERAFRHALKGFSATLGKGQLKKLRADAAVVAVVPDERIELAAQSVPTGVSRVYGQQSDIAAIDGVDQRVDADVAIVDTGIALHPDLNVVGGIDCSTSDPTAWRDRQSHGTHVAGIVGALDNDIGVVRHRARRPSLGGQDPRRQRLRLHLLVRLRAGLDPCAARPRRPLAAAHRGRQHERRQARRGRPRLRQHDPLGHAPGGLPGGRRRHPDRGRGHERADLGQPVRAGRLQRGHHGQRPGGAPTACAAVWRRRLLLVGQLRQRRTFANFSNFGADVDLIAPGKCIRFDAPRRLRPHVGDIDGHAARDRRHRPLSLDAPVRHPVAGAHGPARPRQPGLEDRHRPRQRARAAARRPSHRRPGDFDVDLPGGTLALDESGGPIPITISRTPEAFEPVVFSVGGLPVGASATVTPNTSGGFDATAATLRVNLPATVPTGTFHLTVTGTIQGRSRSDDVAVTFTRQGAGHGRRLGRHRHLAQADLVDGADPRLVAQGDRAVRRHLGLRGRALGRRGRLEQGRDAGRPDAQLGHQRQHRPHVCLPRPRHRRPGPESALASRRRRSCRT